MTIQPKAPANSAGDRRFLLSVVAVEPAGPGTSVYRFARTGGGILPPAEAGSHVTLHLRDGIDRQYSLLHPDERPQEYMVAVRREANGRGGSALIHDQLREGDVVEISGPRNNFALVEAATYSVLIGGGIGVTPLISMATRLMELDRPFEFHAAFRSGDALLLPRELAGIPRLNLHFDDQADGLFPMAATVRAAPRTAHLYCCGPTRMIESFLDAAHADGRNPSHIAVEYFAPVAASPQSGSFIVELARSGLILSVPPGKSILEVVREAGVDAGSSCEAGTCGACEVRVLDGVPDHFDAVLSPKDRREGKSMMICCSGSLTDRLVLDL